MNLLNYFANYLKYGVFGKKIRLETSSICQLKCPECPQNKGDLGAIGQGYLKSKDFRKFVNDYPSFRDIEISNYGEIFLNPDLGKILEYAYEKDIRLTAENGVNLNTADDGILEMLVKYRVRSMYLSLDGASRDTYKVYRAGGDFDKVIANIKKINQFKERYGSKYPKLTWQFIVFGHNEHEIPQAKKMAAELGMDFKPKLNAHAEYSPIKDKDYVRREIGVSSRDEYEKKTGNIYKFPCYQLWFSPMINWDGKLLGCCLNEWEDFGNVFESGLKSCVSNEKYSYMKQMLLGKKKEREDMPCLKCAVYPKVKKYAGSSVFPEAKFIMQVLKGKLGI